VFELDPYSSHMMPAHFGSSKRPDNASMWYRDITSMVVPFRTDREQLAAYLPAPFEVAEDAIVTVTYACNRQVDWLAGHGYNLIAINAAAIFRGEEETMEGDYTLVIWENLADPILTGREPPAISAIVFSTCRFGVCVSQLRKNWPTTKRKRRVRTIPWAGALCRAYWALAKASMSL